MPPAASSTRPVARTKESSGRRRRSRRGKQSRTKPSCQTCRALSTACVKSRDSNHARPHSGCPWSIRPLLGSMRTAEKVLKVHAQPLTLSCLHNNNSPPGCLLQQANAVQSQGPEKVHARHAPKDRRCWCKCVYWHLPGLAIPLSLQQEGGPKLAAPQSTIEHPRTSTSGMYPGGGGCCMIRDETTRSVWHSAAPRSHARQH